MASRAVSSAVLTAFACLATFAVVSYQDSAMGFVAESVKTDEVNVLNNLIDLKSYAISAQEKVGDFKYTHPGQSSVMLDFVTGYGKQTEGGNVVNDYVSLVGALKQKYPSGVDAYVLDNIDQAVRHNPTGAVYLNKELRGHGKFTFKAGGGAVMAMKRITMGTQDTPVILEELTGRFGEYLSAKSKISEQAEDADAVAAMLFMKSKAFGQFQSFLEQEIQKVRHRMEEEFGFVAHHAYDAEKVAFADAYEADVNAMFEQIKAQAPAGMEAARLTAAKMKWTPPSMKEMQARANVAAKEFMEKMKNDVGGDTSALIKDLVQQVSGIKLFIRTAGNDEAESRMTPKVTFFGKDKKKLVGDIRSVPGKNHLFVQHFPSEEDIGTITKVVLTPNGEGEKWTCSSFKIRSGAQDAPIVKFVTKTADKVFVVESGTEMVLVPQVVDASLSEYDTEDICVGWVGTDDCEADGAVTQGGGKSCSDPIESGHSGYCQCTNANLGNKKAKVGCADEFDPFTCLEICAAA